jgi:hypothetical protein
MDSIDTDDTLNRRNTIVTFPELNMVTPMFLPRVARFGPGITKGVLIESDS